MEKLALQVTAPAPGVLRVHITAAGAPRWEVPRWLYPADSVAGARLRAAACRTEVYGVGYSTWIWLCLTVVFNRSRENRFHRRVSV